MCLCRNLDSSIVTTRKDLRIISSARFLFAFPARRYKQPRTELHMRTILRLQYVDQVVDVGSCEFESFNLCKFCVTGHVRKTVSQIVVGRVQILCSSPLFLAPARAHMESLSVTKLLLMLVLMLMLMFKGLLVLLVVLVVVAGLPV